MKTIHNFHSLSLRNLSEKNKRKLYLTIVRPQLLYPIIPLNIISKTAHKKLQKVQNKALRFIENTTLNDRIISTTLHARNKLPTINTYLHRRAINVWTQLLQDKNPELYDKLKPNEEDPRRHSRFPSTFLTTNSPEPLPIYTIIKLQRNKQKKHHCSTLTHSQSDRTYKS